MRNYRRGNKYRAIRCEVDGIKFDSKMEARRYGELKVLLQAGTIKDLEVHPWFEMAIKGQHICKIVLDFSYMTDVKMVYEDVKGHDNALSRLKRKMVEAYYGIKVDVIDGYGRKHGG